LLPGVSFLPFDREDRLSEIDERVAAVIVEPIQGEGGVRVPAPSFLPALRARCDAVGALLIFDEVITGFCRTGAWFAAQHGNVCPDLMVLAKALGGGLPLGAFVGRPEVMRTLSEDPPLAHVTTFGGHPVSCAAGLAALRFARRERLWERSARLGQLWREGMEALVGDVVRTVRGKGMLLGLELADAERTQVFCRAAFERGLILNWTLHRDTVVRLAPPLVISETETERALRILKEAVHEAGRR
jgi:acetylornithine/succinyldiaminopimelate/putrescine aminotransferase